MSRILPLLLCVLALVCKNQADLQKKYETALRLYQEQKSQEALVLLKEIYEADSSYTNAALMMGKIHYFDRKFSDSEHIFSGLAEDRHNINARVWHAKALLQLGKPEAALNQLNQVVQDDSGNVEAWFFKGKAHLAQNQMGEAIAAFRTSTAEAQKASLAHLELAAIYTRAHMTDMARKHAQQAEALAPDASNVERTANRLVEANK